VRDHDVQVFRRSEQKPFGADHPPARVRGLKPPGVGASRRASTTRSTLRGRRHDRRQPRHRFVVLANWPMAGIAPPELSASPCVCFNVVVTLRWPPNHALRTILLGAMCTLVVACGIPWRNLQNGSHSDAAGADATRDVLVDVPVTIDALGDASDVVSADLSTDLSIDAVRATDTFAPDTSDTRMARDVTDIVDITDTGVADSADVQAGCYGVSSSCSGTAPCCAGLTCTGGTCTSSCVTYTDPCSGGSACCAGLTCTLGYCLASTCQTPHQSCSGAGGCCVGLTCAGGSCSCPIGETTCRLLGVDYCANLNTSTGNCGMCGHRCATGNMCVAGVCD